MEDTAGTGSFMNNWRWRKLARRITARRAAPLTAEEKAAAVQPACAVACIRSAWGCAARGARVELLDHLHQPGGMEDRELYAAADLACERQVWDRCINT
ncbi:hypothetical protein J4714_13455, partial [Staphylococcus epidermidis]|nr:hypothetical protein [Staphylococcus epidermidis]